MVANVSNGRFGGGLLRLTWLFGLRGFNRHDTIVIAGLIGLTRGIRVRCPLRDGAGENLQELARVQLAVEDCGLRKKWREEESVAGSPVTMFLGSRKVAGGGAKKDLCDRKSDIFDVCGEGDLDVERNY